MALYDPREFPETKVGTAFTIAEFRDWVVTKDADEEYNYFCNGHCAVAQFLRETGRADEPNVDPGGWSDGEPFAKRHCYPREIDKAAIGNGDPFADCVIQTFGALADRLAKLVTQ